MHIFKNNKNFIIINFIISLFLLIICYQSLVIFSWFLTIQLIVDYYLIDKKMKIKLDKKYQEFKKVSDSKDPNSKENKQLLRNAFDSINGMRK